MSVANTPTGLHTAQVLALSDADAQMLAGWHATKAGDNDGRPWWPWAIRAMPLEPRLRLASDPLDDAVWESVQRRYVINSVQYFVQAFGHVQPPVGDPIPFRLWPTEPRAVPNCVGATNQEEVLDAFVEHLRVIVLKARQLGLTWLALHYVDWLMAFAEHTPRARILGLSKTEEDAKQLLHRARRIFRLLPPFLRPPEDARTAPPSEARGEMVLIGRGSMKSLVSTPAAARSETATVFLWDEAAFTRHGNARETWTSALGTMGTTGQAIVISTGYGPPDAPGDGQAFAQLYTDARAGAEDMHAIFLPDSLHPDRDEEWRFKRARQFLSIEEFEQEHPETEEQALQGSKGDRVYPLAGIVAAERLGQHFDELLEQGRMPPPAGDLLRVGSDYGEHTAHLIIWPLEQGGLWIVDEVVGGGAHGMTDADAALEVCRRIDGHQWLNHQGVRWPLAGTSLYDAAGSMSQRTFRQVIEQNPPLYPAKDYPDRDELQARTRAMDVWLPHIVRGAQRMPPTRGVPFGAAGLTGRGSLKQSIVNYCRWLLQNVERGDKVKVMAISHRCVVFRRQLKGLEKMPDGSGRVKKGDDHGPDAMLAGAYPSVAAYHGVVLVDKTDDQEAA